MLELKKIANRNTTWYSMYICPKPITNPYAVTLPGSGGILKSASLASAG